MQVSWANFAMMSSWGMFGEIIIQVLGALAPVDNKLQLTDPILDPREWDIHGFGIALAQVALGNPSGAQIAGLN